MAIGSGVRKVVRPLSRRAAEASASSHRRVGMTSAGCSGNRATSRSPIRKMAFTVPDEGTERTGSAAHCGNCARTSSRTASAETVSCPLCMWMGVGMR